MFNLGSGVIVINPNEVVLYPFGANPAQRTPIVSCGITEAEILQFLHFYAASNFSNAFPAVIFSWDINGVDNEVIIENLSGDNPVVQLSGWTKGKTRWHVDGFEEGVNRVIQILKYDEHPDELNAPENRITSPNGREVSLVPISGCQKWVFGLPKEFPRRRELTTLEECDVEIRTGVIEVPVEDTLVMVRTPNLNVPHEIKRYPHLYSKADVHLIFS